MTSRCRAHLLLSKLATKAGGHVVAALDTICRPLEKTLTSKLKQDAVKQEVSPLSCRPALGVMAAVWRGPLLLDQILRF